MSDRLMSKGPYGYVDVLRRMRISRHIIMGEMADEMGWPVTKLSSLEMGRIPMTQDVVDLICQIYDVDEAEMRELKAAMVRCQLRSKLEVMQ